jgi:Glycosyltransferase WbsX
VGVCGWARLVEHFKDPNYQTVLDGRPLLFVFVKTTKLGKLQWDQLKRQTIAAGMKLPYLVLMGWNPEQDAKDMTALGFDAISAYARGGSYSLTQPNYTEQCAMIRRDRWEKCRALGIPCVTFASAGWDTRPRNEHPPSWITGVTATPDHTPPAQQKPLMDAVTATPDELAAHLREALDWTQRNRDLNPCNAIIIYGWNENDEGGWLIPTLGADGRPNEERIKALSKVLRTSLSLTPATSTLSPRP